MVDLELMDILRHGIELFGDAFERLEICVERLQWRTEQCELIDGGGNSTNQISETIAQKDQFLLVDLDLIFGLNELEERMMGREVTARHWNLFVLQLLMFFQLMDFLLKILVDRSIFDSQLKEFSLTRRQIFLKSFGIPLDLFAEEIQSFDFVQVFLPFGFLQRSIGNDQRERDDRRELLCFDGRREDVSFVSIRDPSCERSTTTSRVRSEDR